MATDFSGQEESFRVIGIFGRESVKEDLTQYQTAGAQSAGKKLSLQSTAPPADVPGYRLQRFLGAGAFGQVWVGSDLNTGRPVAVKFCLHRGGVNWSLLSHEVKNLVQLSANRCVVQVLEVGWDADPPYYVMEWVGGGSLADLLKVRKELPVGEAVGIFRKICVGLNHCHGKGVLHCDIKPANILMGEDNEPRLADFGQSRMTSDQTPALGTLFYMAPEQADLESTPDACWDVYAVGAILYRMLTGKPPYRDDRVVDEIDTAGSLPKRLARYRDAIAQSPPPELHLQRRGVDRRLAGIVSRCLAVDPQDRYANVQQILDDLNHRDEVRAQRPLMIMGILGPLLLLTATCIFAARTIFQASESTMSALRTEAFGSNALAARFAARTLESEIDRYFRVARTESSNQDFVLQLRQVLADEDISETLHSIAQAGTAAAAADMSRQREALLNAPQKQKLDKLLERRLQDYTSPQPDKRRPRLASMFVTDSKGTIVSIAYDEPVPRAKNSAGRNYSYRTYFHGGKDDLSVDTAIDSITPLAGTHLSAPFRSTATFLWKVAISQPIFLDDDQRQPNAVFVVTLNLGDFQLPASEEGANQIAVLVDARDGAQRGIVLQHPLMDARRRSDKRGSDIYQVPAELMDQLIAGGDVDYLDPMAEADGGEAFAGHWIAAMQPVSVPIQDKSGIDGPETTDLLVLVQYRLAKVFSPVGEMRTQLLWEGAAGVLSILLVTFVLWYFVRRDRDSRPSDDDKFAVDTSLLETLTADS